jgi:uncharacterized protein
VDESGCGLLLDLSHARIAALQLGVDERDYINSLPVDRLRELHITGLRFTDEDGWYDHSPMRAEDWVATQWAIEQIQAGHWAHPWAVALEYGGIGAFFKERSRNDVLAVDIPRLYELIGTVPEK